MSDHRHDVGPGGECPAHDPGPNLRHEVETLAADLATAQAKVERLTNGIESYLSGDYDRPRTYRPRACSHGVNYYSDCGQCDAAHFRSVLAAPDSADNGTLTAQVAALGEEVERLRLAIIDIGAEGGRGYLTFHEAHNVVLRMAAACRRALADSPKETDDA